MRKAGKLSKNPGTTASVIKKSKRGSANINLNAEATDKFGEVIVCRHLSFAAANNNIKNYHDNFSTVMTLAAIESLKNNDFDNKLIDFRSKYYCLLSLDDLGQYIQHVASLLNINEQTSLQLGSENHAMAINIQHKAAQNGKSIYVIKFYDPNHTAIHKKVVFEQLEPIKELSISL